MQSPSLLAVSRFALGCASLLAACSNQDSSNSLSLCSREQSARGECADLAPVPQLHFQTAPPASATDYPYDANTRPSPAIVPRSNVYLSADGSADPEGKGVAFFWNVQDRSSVYQTIYPKPAAAQVSFMPSGIGEYTITLQVTEQSGLRQTGQRTITLEAAPRACAPDGISIPCSDLLPVPGGTFQMGSADAAGETDERPRHTANVAAFNLDKYEVTVGRFRRYLEIFEPSRPVAGAGTHPLIANSGWRTEWNAKLPTSRDEFAFAISECGGPWTDDPGPNEARPVSCITWYEALAFCISEDKRLPTEAEWEFAAAGGDEQRTYPWGNEQPANDRAVFGCLFDGTPTCSDADLPVAGSVPGGAGRFGQLDLAGSLWEWTLDAYAPYGATTCDNCAETRDDALSVRVFRGGDFRYDDPSVLRAASRYAFNAAFPDQTRGLRCARSEPPGF